MEFAFDCRISFQFTFYSLNTLCNDSGAAVAFFAYFVLTCRFSRNSCQSVRTTWPRRHISMCCREISLRLRAVSFSTRGVKAFFFVSFSTWCAAVHLAKSDVSVSSRLHVFESLSVSFFSVITPINRLAGCYVAAANLHCEQTFSGCDMFPSMGATVFRFLC